MTDPQPLLEPLMPSPHRLHARGLTLVELLVVIALVGILIALAAPSMRGPDLGQTRAGHQYRARHRHAVRAQRGGAPQPRRAHRLSGPRTIDLLCAVHRTRGCAGRVARVRRQWRRAAAATAAARRRRCVCIAEPGREEIKTVQVPAVSLASASAPAVPTGRPQFRGGLWRTGVGRVPGALPVAFDVSVTGTPRGQLRTTRQQAGRPSVCSPDGSISGAPRC